MELGSLDGWVSSVLSGFAILVGVFLAALALRQSGRIAVSQKAMEEESYLSGRMQGLVEHARATLVEARTIQDLTSPHMSNLLSFTPDIAAAQASERRTTVLGALTRLQVEVELLRIYAITMPLAGTSDTPAREALSTLMDEGAWLYSEALHVSSLAFEEAPDEDVDLSDDHAIVEFLLNGAFMNLPTRLLSDCVGLNPDDIPKYREPGSPWPAVYKRREKMLMDQAASIKGWRPDSITEVGVWSLDHTSNRFQDALMTVLEEWDALRTELSSSSHL